MVQFAFSWSKSRAWNTIAWLIQGTVLQLRVLVFIAVRGKIGTNREREIKFDFRNGFLPKLSSQEVNKDCLSGKGWLRLMDDARLLTLKYM